MATSFVRKRTFITAVPASGSITAKEFELPSDMETIIGLAVTSDRRDLCWARASLSLNIAGSEIIGDSEDCTEYMFGIEHPSRFWPFGELPLSGDRRMRGRVTDVDVPGRAFSPYVVKIVITYRTSK